MTKIELGRNLIKELIKNGYNGFFVGGFVRDNLLNREINDIDIATDALPEIVIRIFPRTIPTGLKHGTVTVLLKGVPIEVTTFRNEGKYLDHRHPSKVEFVSSLYEDLRRRDFTMNAIAMDVEGNIIDPFNGQDAINHQIISAVDNPDQRFLEDPLRMIRAIRFAAQLDFNIEELTWQGIISNAAYLQFIAPERIKVEFDKIMKAAYSEKGFRLLFESGLIKWIKGINDTNIVSMNYHYISNLIKLTDEPLTRWFLFLYPAVAEERTKIMKSLRFANKEILTINKLFRAYHELSQGINLKNLKKCLVTTDESYCLKAIHILFLFEKISLENKKNYTKYLFEVAKNLKVRKINDLAISGNDLIAYFKEPSGSWIKEILTELLEKVIYSDMANEKNVLLEQAKNLKEGKINEGQN